MRGLRAASPSLWELPSELGLVTIRTMSELTLERFRGWTGSVEPRVSAVIQRVLLCLTVMLATACGRTSVDVSLPSDAVEVRGEVVSGGMVIGNVVSLADTGGNKVATVEFTERDLAREMLRPGVIVWVEATPSGELLDFDVSEAGDGEIPGTTALVAQRRTPIDRAEAYAQRWARNGTLVTIAVGAIVALVLAFVLRSLLGSVGGFIMIAFSVGLAAGLAYLVNGLVASLLLEFVYPHLGGGPASITDDLGLPPEVVRGLADPRVVAFLVVAFPMFLVVMSLLRSVTRPRRKSESS